MDVIPQLDLKLSNTGWSKYSEGRLQTSPTTKKEDCRQVFCLWLTPIGSVEKLTLMLPRLALLQLPRIKYSVSWLEISMPITRCYHIWRNSTTLLKTLYSSDVRQEGLWVCTPQLNVNGSTTLNLPHDYHQVPRKLASTKRRHQHLWPTMTLGWIGLTPNTARLGIVGTWSTTCDSCNCLLIAMCVLDIVCSCLVCFLSECCYFVLVPVFGLLALKTSWCVKEPWLGNLSLLCVPSYLFMPAQVA
jgi:hypothetical protein